MPTKNDAGGIRLSGIDYLRPGHIDPTFTSETLQAILDEQLELTPPFIMVVRRDGTQVTIRVRAL